MILKPHSNEWYERLATMQKGNYYPWQSTLPPFNGEDVYLDDDDSFDLLISRRGPINVRSTYGFSRDQIPSSAEVEPVIKKIFREYAKREGVELRFRRFLWKAMIEKRGGRDGTRRELHFGAFAGPHRS